MFFFYCIAELAINALICRTPRGSMEVPTDEDESEPEEECELSEKEQRLLHEAYDTYATTGHFFLLHSRTSDKALSVIEV